MYLVYRFFNSVIFMLVNITIAMYTCRRFFAVMKSHYKLVAEVAQFNAMVRILVNKMTFNFFDDRSYRSDDQQVRQSRLSLDFMNTKVSEAMKEIEGDIGKELYVTHHLTKISSKMALVLRRFNALEEGVIELVRMGHNTDSIKVETPRDINTEVKKILTAARKKERYSTSELPKTPKNLEISTTTFVANDSTLRNAVLKMSNARPRPSIRAKSELTDISGSLMADIGGPAVKLLSEQRHSPMSKSIGFRPTWKCES